MVSGLKHRVKRLTKSLKACRRLLLGSTLNDVLMSPPGMTTLEERNFCYEYAKQHDPRRGVIVDLGCWLGATTLSLAKGLNANPTFKFDNTPTIHAYDQFQWQSWMETYVIGTEWEGKFKEDDSFLTLFQQEIAQHSNNVQVHAGDLTQQIWNGSGIDFLFVDVIKNVRLAAHVTQEFFPGVNLGGLVVQQDFAHYFTGWIHLIHYQFRNHFTPYYDVPKSCSTVFKLERLLPEVVLQNIDWMENATPEFITRAFEYSRSITDKAKHGRIYACEVMTHLHLEQKGASSRLL